VLINVLILKAVIKIYAFLCLYVGTLLVMCDM